MQKAGQLSSHADCRNKYHPGMIGVRMKPADQQNEADHQRSTDQFRHWQGMAMRALIQLQTEQSSIFHPLLQNIIRRSSQKDRMPIARTFGQTMKDRIPPVRLSVVRFTPSITSIT